MLMLTAAAQSSSSGSSILTKLGMTSRTQAALWAVREGLGPAAR